MGDTLNASGRTGPHLTVISQHVSKTCRGRQPFIMGKHPKNLPRLSQHVEHQKCFISASSPHMGGSFLTLFNLHFYVMSTYCHSFRFVLIPCSCCIRYLLMTFDVTKPKSSTDTFDFPVRFTPSHISNCWNCPGDRKTLFGVLFFCCFPTNLKEGSVTIKGPIPAQGQYKEQAGEQTHPSLPPCPGALRGQSHGNSLSSHQVFRLYQT